jgi:hypothetical protein
VRIIGDIGREGWGEAMRSTVEEQESVRALAAARAALWPNLVPGWRAIGASTYRVEDRGTEVRFLLDYHDWRLRLRIMPSVVSGADPGAMVLEASIGPRNPYTRALDLARHGTAWHPFAWARIERTAPVATVAAGLVKIHNALWCLPRVSSHVNRVYSAR